MNHFCRRASLRLACSIYRICIETRLPGGLSCVLYFNLPFYFLTTVITTCSALKYEPCWRAYFRYFQMLAVAFGLVLSVHVFIRPTCSFYVPGVAPLDFRSGEHVEVKVSVRSLAEID